MISKKTDAPFVCGIVPNVNYTYVSRNNMHIFKGSENALNLTREYYVEWMCDYEYQWYPFDTQVCRMNMMAREDHTDFHPVSLSYNPEISLWSYTLTKIHTCRSRILEKEAILVEVTMGRPIMNSLLTIFIPTTLLLVISSATRAFAQEYLDMVIQANLTIILVLATM